MHSNSVTGPLGVLLMMGVVLTACERSQEAAPTPLATMSIAPAKERVLVVESQRDSIDHGSIVVFALDFASEKRTTAPGDRQIDSVHPLPGDMTGCVPDNEAAYVAAMGEDLRPKDTGYVGTVRMDLFNASHAPSASSTLCYAVHTRGGGWSWRFTKTPIVVDYGASSFDGKPGGGHFDVDVKTADVDLIAFTMGYGGDALRRVTYTAIPKVQ